MNDKEIIKKYEDVDLYYVEGEPDDIEIHVNGYYYCAGDSIYEEDDDKPIEESRIWRSVEYCGFYISLDWLKDPELFFKKYPNYSNSFSHTAMGVYDCHVDMCKQYIGDYTEAQIVEEMKRNYVGIKFKDPKKLTNKDIGKTYLMNVLSL